MSRIWTLFLKWIVIVGMVFSLSGCLDSRDSSILQDMASGENQEQMELEVYGWDSEAEVLMLLADQYMKRNPAVKIQLNLIPESEYSQYMMRLKDGKLVADCVFFPEPGEAGIWVNKRLFRNMEDWLDQDEIKADYAQWSQRLGDESGYYQLPYRLRKLGVIYNQTLFDNMDIPYPSDHWTWEQYQEIAYALTDWEKHERIYGSQSFLPGNNWWMLLAYTRGAYDPFNEKDLGIFKQAADWCWSFNKRIGEKVPYNGNKNNDFQEGKLGMFFGTDETVKQLNKIIQEQGLSLSYGIAPLPGWEGEEVKELFEPAVVAMVKQTKYPDQVYDFINFVTGSEGAAILAANSIVPASHREMVRDQYLKSAPRPEETEFFITGMAEYQPLPGVYHRAATEILEREVALYLLGEQNSDDTFLNINGQLSDFRRE